MKSIHYYALMSTSVALAISAVSHGDETSCESCEWQAASYSQPCNQPERISYRYRYRTFYPVGCSYPYYHKEYGVARRAQWAGRIYEPFHEQLAR